jgi:hypothetical protein
MKHRFLCAFLVLFLGGLSTWAAAPKAGARFVQDRFCIGAFWLTFPMDKDADQRFAEIAEANFTVVYGPVDGFSVEAVKRHLALCEKHGLKAIAHCRAPVDQWPDGPACWGYRLWDEPPAKMFGDLAKRLAEVRKLRPGRLGDINLYPDYAKPHQMGVETYDEYVSLFLATVDVDVLCMDHYPIFKPQQDSRHRYCRNLETMRKFSLKKGIPFWNYFNTAPFGPHTDPTEAQIRWQIYTSIAYGAKGVNYFTYGTPKTFEFPKGSSILRRDGTRTRHWQQAKRINGAIKNLGPTLMKLTNTGMYRVEPKDDPAKMLKDCPITNLKRVAVDPLPDYLIGTFKHADGRRAVMLNNYRFAYTAWPTVEFDVPTDQVHEVDQKTGRVVPIYDDSPNMEGLQVSLDAGVGRLFLLPKK